MNLNNLDPKWAMVGIMNVWDAGRLDRAVNRLEERMVLKAYSMSGGNKAKTGRLLGVSRTRVIFLLKKYGHWDKIQGPINPKTRSRKVPASPYCDMATKQPAIIAT